MQADDLKAYLLGEDSEERASEIEERLFSEPELGDLCAAVEAELFDDYVAGIMSTARTELFETRFLSDARGRERLAFARAIAGAGESSASHQPTTSPWQRLIRWLQGPRLVALGGAVAIAIVVLVALPRSEPESSEVAEITLRGDVVRGDSSPPTLRSDQPARLRLEVPAGTPAQEFRVSLESSGQALSIASQEDKRVIVELKAGLLAPGRYTLVLSGSGADALAYYEIAVVATEAPQ